MKNEINVNDEVVFLYSQHLFKAIVIKINKKTFKLSVPPQKGCIQFNKNVEKSRVASINDEFTMVWKSSGSVNGTYRIDYETYPDKNTTADNWHQPFTYINE